MKMQLNIAVLAALLLLSGCKKGDAIVCVPLVPYSADFQKAVDREIAQIEAPYLFQMLNDYGVTRDAIRKCIKRRNKK
jgi:hypothetical protein